MATVDATIAFPSGLTVSWGGQPLGNIKMDSVKVVGDVGATIDVESSFEVADISHLTEFTKVSHLCLGVISSVEACLRRRFLHKNLLPGTFLAKTLQVLTPINLL